MVVRGAGLALLTLVLPLVVAVGCVRRATCTEVIGFSQTYQWFYGGPSYDAFQSRAGDDRWQLRWTDGASIDRWADPSFSGWSAGVGSPCAQNSGHPDRVMLTITGDFQSAVGWWAYEIAATIQNVRAKYPGVSDIVLQPVVGGPNNTQCFIGNAVVRASYNHPVIDFAIAAVARGDVLRGASPEVGDCSQYADTIGHLNDAGRASVAQQLGEFYRGW